MVNVLYNKSEQRIVTLGEYNRERILEYIYSCRYTGARARDIIKKTNLSKEAVHNNLLNLIRKKRIYKRDRRYYPVISISNEVEEFSRIMKDKAFWLIDKELMNPNPDTETEELKNCPRPKLYQKIEVTTPEKIETIHDTLKVFTNPDHITCFMKSIQGSILSDKYCITHFPRSKLLERNLFEFSNRIGAYIAYIFLQALYPIKNSKLNNQDRKILANTMIEKSIILNDFFESFKELLTVLGVTDWDLETNEYEKQYELSRGSYDTYSNVMKSIYPNLYIAFENWWFHTGIFSSAIYNKRKITSDCSHEWQKIHPFKFPHSLNMCSKCQMASTTVS